MLKGYCRMGDVQTGFRILRRMKEESGARPDEIMYNTLLDGCVRGNLADEGLKLLEEMQSEGVKPSNYTLSILVKMMSRARKCMGTGTQRIRLARAKPSSARVSPVLFRCPLAKRRWAPSVRHDCTRPHAL